MQIYKRYRIGKFTTSNIELTDLLKAWIAVSVAFALVLGGFSNEFFPSLLISLIVVGTGFLLHELGHKIVAQKYNYFAEFRSFDEMLLLAVIMSFFGFVFAAPGAVMIGSKTIREDHNGRISLAGPLINIFLALLFLIIFYTTHGFVNTIANYGLRINSWLCLFNLIPVWQFDGAKIWRWNKLAWSGMAGIGLLLLTQALWLPNLI